MECWHARCINFSLQAVGGRTLTGHETFSATVRAPDGALSAVPVVLAEGGAHYQATLQWLQTGIHKVQSAELPHSCAGYLLECPGRS